MRKNKTYKKKLTKYTRQMRTRKTLAFLLFLAVAFAGYWGYISQFNHYALAEVNVDNQEVVVDGRTISEHVWDLMDEFDFTLDEKIRAVSVMLCESNANPYAIGDGGMSTGLWQIHRGYHKDITVEETLDVYASTRWALQKYRDSGNSWELWTCGR